MQRFACIQDDVVVQIIELPDDLKLGETFHPDFVATLVPATASAVEGSSFKDGKFSAPPVIDLPPRDRLTFREFMRLFTKDEQFAIKRASMADVDLGLWYDQAVGALYIDLGDPDLSEGLQALVDAKLITTRRKDRVLSSLGPED